MSDMLEILSVEHPHDASKGNVDYKIGRVQLSKHFNIENALASLAVSREYAQQLLLQQPSDFPSGRVPLYVCECCADLGCGALTVRVEKTGNDFVWSDFGYEGLTEEGISQSEYMQHTGPFYYVIKPPPLAEDPNRFYRSGVAFRREKPKPPCVASCTRPCIRSRIMPGKTSLRSVFRVATAAGTDTNTFYAPFEGAS